MTAGTEDKDEIIAIETYLSKAAEKNLVPEIVYWMMQWKDKYPNHAASDCLLAASITLGL